MSRDDSILYSGASSASFSSSRQKIVEKKREVRGALQPAAEVINDIVISEKRLITEQLIRLPIDMKTTDEDVKSTLLAVQMNLAFIERFHNKVNNMLREPRAKQDVDDPEEDLDE